MILIITIIKNTNNDVIIIILTMISIIKIIISIIIIVITTYPWGTAGLSEAMTATQHAGLPRATPSPCRGASSSLLALTILLIIIKILTMIIKIIISIIIIVITIIIIISIHSKPLFRPLVPIPGALRVSPRPRSSRRAAS